MSDYDTDPSPQFREVTKRTGWTASKLAPEFGVSEGTMRNWRGKGGVPRRAWPSVWRWLKAIQQTEESTVIKLEVSEEQFDRYDEAAKNRGMKIKPWMLTVLDEVSLDDLGILRVAEPPPSYGLTAEQKAEVDEVTDEVIAELEEEAGESV